MENQRDSRPELQTCRILKRSALELKFNLWRPLAAHSAAYTLFFSFRSESCRFGGLITRQQPRPAAFHAFYALLSSFFLLPLLHFFCFLILRYYFRIFLSFFFVPPIFLSKRESRSFENLFFYDVVGFCCNDGKSRWKFYCSKNF